MQSHEAKILRIAQCMWISLNYTAYHIGILVKSKFLAHDRIVFKRLEIKIIGTHCAIIKLNLPQETLAVLHEPDMWIIFQRVHAVATTQTAHKATDRGPIYANCSILVRPITLACMEPMEKPAIARCHLSRFTRYFFSIIGMQLSSRVLANAEPCVIIVSFFARTMPSFMTIMKGTAFPSAIKLSMICEARPL